MTTKLHTLTGSIRARRAVLGGAPPIVTPVEIDRLSTRLAAAGAGEAFLLEITGARGHEQDMRSRMRLLAGLSAVLTYALGRQVVLVTHGAAQSPFVEFDVEPERLLHAYAASAGAMNLVRAMHLNEASTLDDVGSLLDGAALDARSARLVDELHHGLLFAASYSRSGRVVGLRDMFTSHQAVLLDYEREMMRVEGRPGYSRPYACSAHLLWTVPPVDGPSQMAFGFAGLIANPVGLALGPQVTPAAAVHWLSRLDPECDRGRVVLRLALGHDRVTEVLPNLVSGVVRSGHEVVWQCDPVSANVAEEHLADRVVAETANFVRVLSAACQPVGGLHLDLTRLRPAEAIDTALLVAEVLRA